MADCYAVFKTTYSQAIADGLSAAVATAAAQSAMAACLSSQGAKPTTNALATTTVDTDRYVDSGPTMPPPSLLPSK